MPVSPAADINTSAITAGSENSKIGNNDEEQAQSGPIVDAPVPKSTLGAAESQAVPDDREQQVLPDSPLSSAMSQRDPIEEEIAAVTPEALDTGAPQPWKVHKLRGYVVPSALQTYGDRVCRNVFASTIDHGDQSQSPPHEWCRPIDGGQWQLAQ